MQIKGPKYLFFLFLCYFSLHATETCFFIPPKGWEIANPEILAPRVHICFLGKTSKGLAPSINLTTEKVTISLELYIEKIRKIHTADPNSRWKDLGKFKTLLGDGRLTKLETPTELGMAHMVQLVVIKEGVAYILTAGAIKEEFPKYYKTFDHALHSLQSSSNLIESYSSQSHQLKELVASVIKQSNLYQFQVKIGCFGYAKVPRLHRSTPRLRRARAQALRTMRAWPRRARPQPTRQHGRLGMS